MLNASLVGRKVTSLGKELVIESVEVVPGFDPDRSPTIICVLIWPDGTKSEGSLAPGTLLWQELNDAGPEER